MPSLTWRTLVSVMKINSILAWFVNVSSQSALFLQTMSGFLDKGDYFYFGLKRELSWVLTWIKSINKKKKFKTLHKFRFINRFGLWLSVH